MEKADIQKAIKDFEAKLTPVTAKMKAMAKGMAPVEETPPPPPPPPPPPAPPAGLGGTCVSKDFKNVINAFKPDFIGKGGTEVQGMVIEFLSTYPECS